MKKGERTKQLIVEKAADLFNVKGIAGTAVEDVLDSAKVTRGCLLGHFKNKEELAYAGTDFLLENYRAKRDFHVGHSPKAIDRIFGYFEMYRQPLRTPIFGGCPIINLAVEADDTNPGISKIIKNEIDDYIGLFTSILKAGKENGEFTGELEAEEFAYKMFAAIEGALLFCRVKNSQKPMKAVISSLRKELAGYTTAP